MKEKLYDIMSDLNEILKDMDALINATEMHFDGIIELYDTEKSSNVLRVNLSVLRAIRDDSNNLYNKIDQMILDMKYEVQAEHTQILNR